jgi:hypothetical protein
LKSTRRSTSTVVWFLVLVALVALAVWQYAVHASQTQSSALWSDVDAASHDPIAGDHELTALANESPGTLAGRTARFQLARLDFQWGQKAFAPLDRAETIKRVNKARDEYHKLQNECADTPLLAQEAMMGVAKADEWLIGVSNPDDPEKDLNQAVASYEKLAGRFPDSFLGREARDRATTLREHSGEVAKLYRQLNQAAPPSSFEETFKPVPETKNP